MCLLPSTQTSKCYGLFVSNFTWKILWNCLFASITSRFPNHRASSGQCTTVWNLKKQKLSHTSENAALHASSKLTMLSSMTWLPKIVVKFLIQNEAKRTLMSLSVAVSYVIARRTLKNKPIAFCVFLVADRGILSLWKSPRASETWGKGSFHSKFAILFQWKLHQTCTYAEPAWEPQAPPWRKGCWWFRYLTTTVCSPWWCRLLRWEHAPGSHW